MGMASSSMYSTNYTTQWSSKVCTPHERTISPECEDPHEWIGVKGEKKTRPRSESDVSPPESVLTGTGP